MLAWGETKDDGELEEMIDEEEFQEDGRVH